LGGKQLLEILTPTGISIRDARPSSAMTTAHRHRIEIERVDALRWSVRINRRTATILHSFAAATAEAESLSIEYQADIWIRDGSQPRRLLRDWRSRD